MHHYVKENFEDVGPRFAEEAKQIHKGEAEERPIHGTATPQEAKSSPKKACRLLPLPKPELDSYVSSIASFIPTRFNRLSHLARASNIHYIAPLRLHSDQSGNLVRRAPRFWFRPCIPVLLRNRSVIAPDIGGRMLLINNQVVEQILDIKGCMEALETGYRDLINERANYRGRYDFFVPNDDPKLMYRWGTMEGASRSFETFAIRMKSDMLEWPEGKTVEKYCVEPGTFCGVVMVFSTRNGEPLAIINDGIIQHMRVGGCAGLGAKYLSREDSSVVGIFGSGGMARTYLLAFNEVRKIREVKVFSPTKKNRETYADEMGEKLGIKIIPVDSRKTSCAAPTSSPPAPTRFKSSSMIRT